MGGRAFRHFLLLALLIAFVISTNHSAQAEKERGASGDADHDVEVDVSLILSSCDDLPDKRTEVSGLVAVQGEIICPENRVRNMSSLRCIVIDLFSVGVYGIK